MVAKNILIASLRSMCEFFESKSEFSRSQIFAKKHQTSTQQSSTDS